jgi:hypothetical protein
MIVTSLASTLMRILSDKHDNAVGDEAKDAAVVPDGYQCYTNDWISS